MKTPYLSIAAIGSLALLAGFGLGAGIAPRSRVSEVVAVNDDIAVEYGTVTIDAKWAGDQTRGASTVGFKTEFAEEPVVVANQCGEGGWHFFVHAIPGKSKVTFSVMLDRSFHGKEPREHPCQIAYVAIGKKAK